MATCSQCKVEFVPEMIGMQCPNGNVGKRCVGIIIVAPSPRARDEAQIMCARCGARRDNASHVEWLANHLKNRHTIVLDGDKP